MAFWKSSDENEAADDLRAYFHTFTDTQASRRSLAERYAAVTEGMNLTCLGPYGYVYDCETASFGDEDQIPIIRNVAHELTDTLVSKIGAIDPPLPTMLTNKGSWKDRRQAADLELLVRAEYASKKGFWSNLHQVWIAALRLAAACTGTVAVQYYNDNGKVGARIHDTLDMAWSPDLRVQCCLTWLPVDDVIEMYPDSEEQIRACVGEPPQEWAVPTRNGEKLTDFVCLYEGWRGAGANAKRNPGSYVVCVKSGPALRVDKYMHNRPPFVWLSCSPHLYGPLGHSLVHHVYESMRRDNLILCRVDNAINSTNESTMFVDKSKLINPDALVGTEDSSIVYTKEDYVPKVLEAPGFSSEHLQVADRHYNDAHGVSGLAASHTQGTRQEGVDSAIGQRYVAALVNERFAALQGRYIQAVAVDSAEVIVQILCDIYEEDPKLMRLAPGQDTLREVAGSVALNGIENLKYVVQYAAVSGNKGNPADRMQTAFEMKQLGIMNDAAFASMQSQGSDLPGALDQIDINRQWVDKQIYRWQFSHDDDVEKPGFYIPPFEHMKIGEALIQVVDGYLEAQMHDLEPDRLEFFFMFISDCSSLAAATGTAVSNATAGQVLPGMQTQAPPMQVQPVPALPPEMALG